jgi:hypothetical protein
MSRAFMRDLREGTALGALSGIFMNVFPDSLSLVKGFRLR